MANGLNAVNFVSRMETRGYTLLTNLPIQVIGTHYRVRYHGGRIQVKYGEHEKWRTPTDTECERFYRQLVPSA